MRQLNPAAQAWMWLVLAGGLGALLLAGLGLNATVLREISAPTLWVFLVLATVAHAFPVVAPRHQAYHATLAFLMASILLMSWPSVALVVLVIHAAEWLRRRRPWYIQLYNIAVYLLSSLAAALVVGWLLRDKPFALGGPDGRSLAIALLAAAVFLIVNHFLTGMILLLARRVSLADSGLFAWESVSVDGALLLLGVSMANAWDEQPLTLLIASAPLVLLYRLLELPGAARSAHRDRLSDLYNKRHFIEALDLELARGRQLGQPTSIIVAGFDDVQHNVQRYGRATLDFLVVALAERVSGLVREYDLVARFGDGSIGLLLPHMDREQATDLARRILDTVAAKPYNLPTTTEPVAATASAAVSTVPPGAASASDLVDLVERGAERSLVAGPRTLLEVEPGTPPIPADGVAPPVTPPHVAGSTPAPPRAWPAPGRWTSRRMMPLLEIAVILPALAVSVAVALVGVRPELEVAGGIIALVVLSELLGFQLFDRSSFSIGFAPILAAGLLGGPVGTILATWSVALVRGLLRRSRWDKVLFNGGAFTLAGLLANGVMMAVDRPVRATELGPLALAAVVASAVYYLQTLPVAAAVALDIGADPRQVWVRNYRWLFPHLPILGLTGLGLAVATVELGPLGAAVFVAPLLMMRFVLKQYTDRTIGSVLRLETANAELRSTSTLLERRGEELALLSDLGQLVTVEAHASNLPSLVTSRCVPVLGDLCAIIWSDTGPRENVVHTAPEAEGAREAMLAQPPGGLRAWAESLALQQNGKSAETGWASEFGGSWATAPLPGHDRLSGWLVSWRRATTDAAEEAGRRELNREVARRLALILEREALLQEAALVDTMRAVDRATADFVATTAHELRTPLTSLQGYAELLSKNDIEPTLRDRWLNTLQAEASQLGLVLDQFLDVSRLDASRFKPSRMTVPLAGIIERAAESFSAQRALTGHVVETDIPPGLPAVRADPTHVERILRNLVSNALKYAPGGGTVRISVVRNSSNDLEVRVEDEGLGIPEEWLGRLFQRFQRVNTPDRASIRGTGLGLYITRQLVEMNGGRIWATSAGPGRGATFHFTLGVAPRLTRRTASRAAGRA